MPGSTLTATGLTVLLTGVHTSTNNSTQNRVLIPSPRVPTQDLSVGTLYPLIATPSPLFLPSILTMRQLRTEPGFLFATPSPNP